MTGPGRGNGARQREEHHRHESQVAATEPHRMPGQLIECPVDIISTGPDRAETIVLRDPYDA